MSQKSVSLTKYMRGANGKTVIHNLFTDLESALIKLRSEQYYSSGHQGHHGLLRLPLPQSPDHEQKRSVLIITFSNATETFA